jgi:hypothetical protein
MSNALRADRAEIDRALRLILEPGQVTELRALEAVTAADGRPHTQSGYYDSSHVDELATAAAKITAKGIYLVINPIEPALIARAANRIKRIGREPLTSDSDIIRRCRLPIDCDPVRPSGISSSDDEHCAALCRARQVRDALQAEGWPAPILADSGNGAHVLFRIDLAADDGGLVQRCLEAIAARFDDPAVTIDQKVFNPARIWRLYGTPARKGDCTPDRPHRLSRIIEAPSLLEVVPAELLEKLAAGAPRQGARERRQSPAGSFDIERWIYEHKLEVRGPELWQGGRRWVFKACPWNSAHTDRSAFIAQHASGAIVARCHHNSCNGKDWHALRDVVEPPWRERSAKAADNCERREHRNGTPTPAAPVLIPMSTVKAEPVKWLWPGRIALGKITVIQGDPDVNKSFLTLDLAARVTRGTPWPDAPSTSAPLGGVVLLTAEDDLADTVRPRLDAAGADVSRINVLQAVQTCSRLRTQLRLLPIAGWQLSIPSPRISARSTATTTPRFAPSWRRWENWPHAWESLSCV